MFRFVARVAPRALVSDAVRHSSSAPKVAVLGASGGIGQPLALLMKNAPAVAKLSLYDIVNTPGVAADLSHIETPARISAHNGAEQLDDCLKGCDVVLIPAGVPRKPGMTRDDLFNVNASIVRDLVDACARNCPLALIGIIANPVNSTVPIAAEVLKKHNTYDPNRLFGVTSLDVVRSNTFIAEMKDLDVTKVNCPVVGGHSGVTIVPIISQCSPSVSFPQDVLEKLTHRIQNAGSGSGHIRLTCLSYINMGATARTHEVFFTGTEVVEAKAGTGSATLSMAFAAMRLGGDSLGNTKLKQVTIYALFEFVSKRAPVTDAKYFSNRLRLGRNGLEENLGLGKLTPYEEKCIEAALPELRKNIAKGEKFVHG